LFNLALTVVLLPLGLIPNSASIATTASLMAFIKLAATTEYPSVTVGKLDELSSCPRVFNSHLYSPIIILNY